MAAFLIKEIFDKKMVNRFLWMKDEGEGKWGEWKKKYDWDKPNSENVEF